MNQMTRISSVTSVNITPNIKIVVVRYLQKIYKHGGTFTLKELHAAFPHLSKFKIGGLIGSLSRYNYIQKKNNREYIFLRPLEGPRLGQLNVADDHEMPPLAAQETAPVQAEAAEVIEVPQAVLEQAVEAPVALPPMAITTGQAIAELLSKTPAKLSVVQMSEALLNMAANLMEVAKPDLSQISSEDLLAEMQRRMAKS
jgi:hypothetical protein